MAAAEIGETPHTQSSQALNIILSNIDMAADDEGPICQDTGMPTFIVHTPVGVNQIHLRKAIQAAVAEATRRDRAHGYDLAKMQLFRTLDDVNRIRRWRNWKRRSWRKRTGSASAPWDSVGGCR
jgi:tartrate dehydratase alpha subunit/fumarate hydratase class I-like protein